jgi:hypothetical protein
MKTLLISISVVMLIMAGAIGYFMYPNIADGVLGDVFPRPVIEMSGDIIGSKIATTTTWVKWASPLQQATKIATTTYIKELGANYDSAIITMFAQASSTESKVSFNILGSNDDGCATTTGVSKTNELGANEVDWTDITKHILGVAQTNTTNSATTTIEWSPSGEVVGQPIILNNLNYECLRMDTAASGTFLRAELKLK